MKNNKQNSIIKSATIGIGLSCIILLTTAWQIGAFDTFQSEDNNLLPVQVEVENLPRNHSTTPACQLENPGARAFFCPKR